MRVLMIMVPSQLKEDDGDEGVALLSNPRSAFLWIAPHTLLSWWRRAHVGVAVAWLYDLLAVDWRAAAAEPSGGSSEPGTEQRRHARSCLRSPSCSLPLSSPPAPPRPGNWGGGRMTVEARGVPPQTHPPSAAYFDPLRMLLKGHLGQSLERQNILFRGDEFYRCCAAPSFCSLGCGRVAQGKASATSVVTGGAEGRGRDAKWRIGGRGGLRR